MFFISSVGSKAEFIKIKLKMVFPTVMMNASEPKMPGKRNNVCYHFLR